MTERNETPQEALARLRKEGASGTLTVHIVNGSPKNCEFLSRWRVPTEDGTVDLTEARK